jgi:hypothetical protein
MSNAIYPLARQAFAAAQISWTADTIRAVLLDSTYVYSESHDMHNDIGGGSIIATSSDFTGKTNVLGVCDANDLVFPTVALGDTINSIVIYKWSGVSSTSPLILYLDRTAASVLIDVDTDGGDIQVIWSNAATKIFRL